MKPALEFWFFIEFCAVVILLSGCSGMNQAGIAKSGADVADEIRSTAQWTLCDAITVGAWRRAYAGQPEKAKAWSDLCSEATGVPIK